MEINNTKILKILKKRNKLYVIKKINQNNNDTWWKEVTYNSPELSYNSPELSYDSPKVSYYSGLLDDKHSIYSFLYEKSANDCVSFLKKYKEIHNKYPNLYNSTLSKLEQPGSQIFVDIETVPSLQKRCLLNNIGLIGITNFDYLYFDKFMDRKNIFDLSISAIDLIPNKVKEEFKVDQIENLNYLLDF